MDSILLSPSMMPFSVALGLLFALLALEVIALLAGMSLFGAGGDADLDFDVEAEFDLDADVDGTFDTTIDVESLEAADIAEADGSAAPSDWLGLGKVPFLIWFASLLLGFGLGGLLLQSGASALLGSALPAGLAAAIVALPALGFTRGFAGVFARLLPKSESSALSKNHLGRRRGVISQGTAARGRPAEVRVQDGFGNTHYLRAEPLRDGEEIPQGAEVLVLRVALQNGYRLVALDR